MKIKVEVTISDTIVEKLLSGKAKVPEELQDIIDTEISLTIKKSLRKAFAELLEKEKINL